MPKSHRKTNDGSDISIVLFDMGGVLVELGSLPELLGGGIDEAEFWPLWLASPAVRNFERGGSSPEEFAAGAVADLDLAISAEAFLTNFARFPRGLFPGAVDLVTDVAAGVEIGVLSNTNELHWETQPDADVLQRLVDRHYLSYRLGEVKPDEAIFQLVLEDLDCDPRTVLFLDDNQINVEGARRTGMRAETVKGPAPARSVLAGLGLLSEAEAPGR